HIRGTQGHSPRPQCLLRCSWNAAGSLPWPEGHGEEGTASAVLLDQLPGAVFDGQQLDTALVKTAVIFGCHVVDALCAGKVLDLFQSVTQCDAELFGTGLGRFQSF